MGKLLQFSGTVNSTKASVIGLLDKYSIFFDEKMTQEVTEDNIDIKLGENKFYILIKDNNQSVNVALNKSITASSEENAGTAAIYAVDGDPTTRWSSSHEENQYFIVNLDRVYEKIDRFEILWEAAYAKSFHIETSIDGKEWTTVYAIEDRPLEVPNGHEEVIPFAVPETARLVKFVCDERATPYGVSLHEFRVFASDKGYEYIEQDPADIGFKALKFTGNKKFNLAVKNSTGSQDPETIDSIHLEYRYNGDPEDDWKTWPSDFTYDDQKEFNSLVVYTDEDGAEGDGKTEIYVRGKNENGTYLGYDMWSDNNIHWYFETNAFDEDNDTLEVRCDGDATAIISYDKDTKMTPYCLTGLFKYSSLVSAPMLPSMKLVEGCYKDMFYGCSKLVEAPNLPATTLAEKCYEYMFYECSSLVKAPDLPAKKMEQSCYHEMFDSCTSLTEAPDLPAMELAEECYSYMFYGCESLVKAPKLPATNLTYECYYDMFDSCTSLTEVSDLPATELAEDCYSYMFYNCESLVKAPKILATKIGDWSCSYMFQGCSSLVYPPELPAMELGEGCYYGMFEDCSSLISTPNLPATNLAYTCYATMFKNCSSLKYPMAYLPATMLAERCYNEMFERCTSLEASPILVNVDDSCDRYTVEYPYGGMFYDCENLKTLTYLSTKSFDNIGGGTSSDKTVYTADHEDCEPEWAEYWDEKTNEMFQGGDFKLMSEVRHLELSAPTLYGNLIFKVTIDQPDDSTDVSVEFECINKDKFIGLNTIVWDCTTGLVEYNGTSSHTYSYPEGTTLGIACKYEFAGGMAVTPTISYVVKSVD